MPTVQVLVEIPEGYELADPKLRPPKKGELFLSDEPAAPHACKAGGNFSTLQVIIRPIWKWPEWLKAPYIAMGPGVLWKAFQHKPQLCGEDWDDPGWVHAWLSAGLFHFDPPPCTDWRQSLRRNPNLPWPEPE